MTSESDERTNAAERLVTALKQLDLLSRIDDEGRVLASDGQNEYEVTVDPTRLLRTEIRRRGIALGRSSLDRLEQGDVTALFSHGVAPAAAKQSGTAASEQPVSSHYAPLEWDRDADNLDDDEGLTAQGDDWKYSIYPVRGKANQILGYRVSGGDYESGDEFGSALIGGEVGELSLPKAKAAADENYASRYREADQILDDLLGDWEGDDGATTCRNERGRIVCRLHEPGIEEVEVIVTLRDYGDSYNADERSVSVSLRTVLSYSHDGDRDALVDDLRRLIRLSTRSGNL